MSNSENLHGIFVKDLQNIKRDGPHEYRCTCPACQGHNFTFNKANGLFYCFNCGAHGKLEDFQKGKDNEAWKYLPKDNGNTAGFASTSGTSGIPNAANTSSSTNASPGTPATDASPDALIRPDYVPLDPAILRTIQDLSTEAYPNQLQQDVRAWLEAQQIPLEHAIRMGLGAAYRNIKNKHDDEHEKATRQPCVVFRNYVEGYCCNAKCRSVSSTIETVTEADGTRHTETHFSKGFTQDSAVKPCAPYNIDCLWPARWQNAGTSADGTPEPPRTLYYTEGEKDAITLTLLGFPYTLGCASGAQTDLEKTFSAFQDWLEPIREVVIVGDQDVPGRSMVRQCAQYFRNKKVRTVTWDQRQLGKDISEVYQRHGREFARNLVLSAQPVALEGIEDYTTADALQASLRCARGEYDHGYDLGLGPLTNQHFRLTSQQAGLIIVTGTPGTGKTDFLNYVTMQLMNQRRTHLCYCSFETPNKYRHAGDLAQIWAGALPLHKLSDQEAMPFVRTVTRHITHLDFTDGGATPQHILERADQVLQRHPELEYLIIDPYLYVEVKEGHNVSETSAIKDMLRTFQHWAYHHNIWVFIVAHPRKLQKADGSPELEEIDMYTIAGSANWANIADMVLSLKRVRNPEFQYDYTRLSVLKVRDQKICTPGDVFYIRHQSGRYAECADETQAKAHLATSPTFNPWNNEEPASQEASANNE